MPKLLIIDDDTLPRKFGGYAPLFKDMEVHSIFYLGGLGDGERARDYVEAEVLPQLRERYPEVSFIAYTHAETVAFLLAHQQEFAQIVLDGLKSNCLEVIAEAKLPLNKTRVVTGDQEIVSRCSASRIPCTDKFDLR